MATVGSKSHPVRSSAGPQQPSEVGAAELAVVRCEGMLDRSEAIVGQLDGE